MRISLFKDPGGARVELALKTLRIEDMRSCTCMVVASDTARAVHTIVEGRVRLHPDIVPESGITRDCLVAEENSRQSDYAITYTTSQIDRHNVPNHARSIGAA